MNSDEKQSSTNPTPSKKQRLTSNRREFLKTTAVTSTVATTFLSGGLASNSIAALAADNKPASGSAGPESGAKPVAGAPAHDAMPTILSRVNHESGLPLGGVGTGSIEIRPDGCFHEWQIFNLGSWGGIGALDMPVSALSFYLWTRPEGDEHPVMRRLSMRTDQNNMYTYSWLTPVEAIEFGATFPVATLKYHDSLLPVTIESSMFSPIAPHDARTSGTPGFNAVFRIKNRSDKRVEVSLLSNLKNPLAWGADDRKLTNKVTKAGETTYLTMRTNAEMTEKETLGSLCMSVSGGEASFVAGEYSQYMNNGQGLRGPFGSGVESLLWAFRPVGKLPNLDTGVAPGVKINLERLQQINTLSLEEKKALAAEFMQYAMFKALAERAQRVNKGQLQTDQGLTQFLNVCRQRVVQLRATGTGARGGGGGAAAAPAPPTTDTWWGDGALCSSIKLQPGEEREIRFTLSWYFPNHISRRGGAPVLGHMYENWFGDAENVNQFLVQNYPAHSKKTRDFARVLFDTTLGSTMPCAWTGQMTTLIKCSWWLKDGKFAIWEGLGCCGFHTTDITYQGSFPIVALFPELQKGQMVMGASFQRADGRIPHFFTPDLSAVDRGFDRVDMNPQFVMLVCRDYLWTGDKDYLRKLWPAIVRAMNSTALLDGDGDGLPDRDTGSNTYDQWRFFGTPAYIASLWLGGLRAAIRVAEDLGETQAAGEWRKTLEKAIAAFEKRLWNGKYYSLCVGNDNQGSLQRDECCMTDQLSGEWFVHLMGLGHNLPQERILGALKEVIKHNYTPDGGMVNARYPESEAAHFPAFENSQAQGNWTGIEYAIASMMIDFGLVQPGLAVVQSVHDRYLRAGRFWNQEECGSHYYRAMSSWATLLAATGFKPDVPRQILSIVSPVRLKELRAPWVGATGWGRFRQTDQQVELECHDGSIGFKELRLALKGKSPKIKLAGQTLKGTAREENGSMVISFADPVTVAASQTLVVSRS
jgi:uncharacterized protein (DUF608 family)